MSLIAEDVTSPHSWKYTILIVDDQPANLGVIFDPLKGHGFRVLVATDGELALQRAEYIRLDLILLDVVMPGLDGFETCRRLKANDSTKDIPVIFMTALTSTEDKVTGFEVGEVDYVTKPIQPKEILARVTTHLRLRELSERLEHKVRERTNELAVTNQILQQEINERKRIEKELKQYRDHLEELVKERTLELEHIQAQLIRKERLSALGQLTATVAHEIRNPLGTVRTSVFAIGDAIKRNEIQRVARALKLAERNIVRCDAIITELLDYTRDRVLQIQPVAIDRWLGTVLDEQLIPEGLRCTKQLHADVEVAIDREHFRRAIVNIVDNAINALQDEASQGNQLTVSTSVVDNRLKVRIDDTGCGIDPDVLDKIFEPLFSTKIFGVGLGMPIVKDIMEKHDGNVEIHSQVGKGTTVLLYLPLYLRK